jgi:hypothetical protein
VSLVDGSLERRTRLAYYQGAQDAAHEATGEPMTAEVEERVIARFAAE